MVDESPVIRHQEKPRGVGVETPYSMPPLPFKVGRQGGSEVIIDGGAAQLIGVRCHQPLSFVVHENLAEIGGGAQDVQANINITSHSSDRGG